MEKSRQWLGCFNKRAIGLLILLASLALNLISCEAQDNKLDATSWKLESYLASSGERVDGLFDSAVTLYFQALNVSGSAGCNNYTAACQADNKSLSFGPAAATRKMCVEPAGIMEQENDFLAALGNVTQFNINGDILTLMDKQGDTIISLLRITAQ